MDKLLPCPFCGANGYLEVSTDNYPDHAWYVRCAYGKCPVNPRTKLSISVDDRKPAIKAWNTRTGL